VFCTHYKNIRSKAGRKTAKIKTKIKHKRRAYPASSKIHGGKSFSV